MKITITDSESHAVGFFDPTQAESFKEDTWLDGNGNHMSKATGSQWDHELLYRTKKGRWVVNGFGQRHGALDTYRYLTDTEALTWLINNGHDDDTLIRLFGELPDEMDFSNRKESMR